MQQKHLKYIQLFSDLLIPILGLLFWNWGLFFIFAFFLLDYLVSVGIHTAKERKISAYWKLMHFPFQKYMSLFLFAFGIFFLSISTFYQIKPGFDLGNALWNFLAYEEMGIAQGFILVPLLVFGGFQQFKTQFLLQNKVSNTPLSSLWKKQFSGQAITLLAAFLVLISSFFIVFPELAYTIGLILGVSAFRFFYKG